MFSKILTKKSTESYSQQIEQLQIEFRQADAVLIGAGSGLSASAGFTYGGERFQNILEILQKSMGSVICIPAGFTRILLLRNIGHGGAVIFIITVM